MENTKANARFSAILDFEFINGNWMSKLGKISYWAETVAWMAVIFYLSGDTFSSSRILVALRYWTFVLHLPLTEATLQSINLVIRKAAHVTEFFIMGLLLYRALSAGSRAFRLSLACWVLARGAAFALIDEFHQSFTTFRTPSLADSALDFSGVVTSQLWLLIRASVSQAEGWIARARKLLFELR